MTAGQLAKRASLTKQLSNASDAALKEPSEGSRQAVETAEKNLADFVQELGKADPAFRDLQPEPSTTAEAQALAKQASCTILTYHLGGRRSQLWVVDAHGVRMLNLPARSRITTEVMALRQGLNRRPTDESKFRAYSDHAGTLYGWLFAPASRSVKPGGKILIVPTASSTTCLSKFSIARRRSGFCWRISPSRTHRQFRRMAIFATSAAAEPGSAACWLSRIRYSRR